MRVAPVSRLAAYQHAVGAALRNGSVRAGGGPSTDDGHGVAGGSELRGAEIMRWSVHQWAAAQLRNVCPLTATLLLLHGRYAGCVADHLARPGRRPAIHPWGLAFLEALADDEDPMVADVARLEHAMTAPAPARLPLPDPWIWTRSPEAVLLQLACGGHPSRLPLLERPVQVRRGPNGHLLTDPVAVAGS